MTRAPWAERKARKAAHSIQPVDFGSCEGIRVFAKTLEDEHKRAVRVVKKEIKWQAARIAEEQQAHNADGEAIHNYALLVVHDILAALQKGRT